MKKCVYMCLSLSIISIVFDPTEMLFWQFWLGKNTRFSTHDQISLEELWNMLASPLEILYTWIYGTIHYLLGRKMGDF